MMSQSLFNRAGTKRALDVRAYTPHRTGTNRNHERELEGKLAALQQDYAELHTAIFEAAQIHRRLCAPRSLSYGNFEIASEIFAVRHLPGDFFTVIPTNDGVILGLGDICGKGLAAGMWTTHLVGSVSRYASKVTDPKVIVNGVNRDLCRMAQATALATLFLARLDPMSGRLDYCSAGHPPARLLRADGSLESLSKGGLILGVAPQANYVTGTVTLGERDTLLIYSDGVTESVNDKNEEFGYARLERELRRARNGRADAILFSVLGAVQDFAAIRPLIDDMSLVIVRRQILES
jgi:phosphoserine phosphatase RsbU/P